MTDPAPRVMHVLEATLGGTRQYLDNLVAAARDLPFRMGLVYARQRSDEGFEGTLGRVRSAGWSTWEVPMWRAVRPARDLRAALAVRKLIRRESPDILHLHSSKAGGVGRLAAASLLRRPWVVYSPHALAANTARRYLLVERLLARYTDRFAAISASERAEIEGFGLARAEAIDVVCPIVDAAHFTPRDRDEARRALGLPGGPLILGIGRFIHQKDPVGFLHVVEAVRERVPDARALWIGEGELQARVEREIAERDLAGCVELRPWQLDVRPWIAASDLLVSTARFESFGYVVAEAMAMERAVVASRVTGTVDVVTGEPATLLYPAGDYRAAADMVAELLRDETRRGKFGALGAAAIRREFSREAMARRLAQAYGRAPVAAGSRSAVA